MENASPAELNIQLINTLHGVLDEISKSFENNDIDSEHHIILVKLFQSLEHLYTNIPLAIEQANEVHAWLQNYSEHYSFENRDLSIIHKLLFAQRIRVKHGEILSGIAKQIERLYGQIEDVSLISFFFIKKSIYVNFMLFFFFFYRNQLKAQQK